jgi:colanic acid biosynthesis glycosyl transferase WcaI
VRIVFVNQFYIPDPAATGQRVRDLAEHLVDQGHEIHVLCGRGSYDGSLRDRLPSRQAIRGVRVRRLAGLAGAKSGRMRRVLDYALFHASAGLRLLVTGWRYDVIVTLTTPPLIGLHAAIVRLLFRRPRHVCWTMDLHPDAEFAIGMWDPRRRLWRMLAWLHGCQLRYADAVVALGPAMKRRLLEHGVRSDRLHVVPMWDRRERPAVASSEVHAMRRELGLTGKVVVLYAGNAGLVHTFDAVCQAMLQLGADESVRFLFVGGGRRLEEVRDFARRHALGNVVFVPYVPSEQVPQMLAAGDVHLVTLRDGLEGISVPCKLYGIMGAARPVIYIGPGDSDTAHHLREAGAGFTLDTNDVLGLVRDLRRLAEDPLLRESCGRAAGRAFDERFAHHHGCRRWHGLLTSLLPALRGKGQPCLREEP